MTASPSSHIQQVLAVNISELDTKQGGNKAVWAGLQEHGWQGIIMVSRCRLRVFALQPNT